MIYASVCSGIEAPSVAWAHLGWQPEWFAEIAPFPSKVLAHHYPLVPNLGDFTRAEFQFPIAVDLLVGGTPCQSFSIAGLRQGLGDPRGNLALAFCSLVEYLRPRWLLWENVPGVLSADGGRAFGSILGALAHLGYGFAWRVLDAQAFGVPQRRRRVFLVGHSSGYYRGPAAVLFEPQSSDGDPAPRGNKRKKAADDFADGAGIPELSHALTTTTTRRNDPNGETFVPVVGALTSGGSAKAGWRAGADEAAAGQLLPVAFHMTQDPISSSSVYPALSANAYLGVQGQWGVRRLTPRECERLMGFPDDYTLIPGASDAARYRAIGNSMAVPVVRWIGERIAFVDGLV